MLRAMFTSKYAPIFRSRWRALWWAACVLATAYCTVPREDGSDPLLGLTEGSAASLGQQHEQEQAHHVNPWALDPAERH